MKEITWSLMHPTHLDAEYMREVIAWADRSPVRVDSFEICARCHSPLGGLDGLVRKCSLIALPWKKISAYSTESWILPMLPAERSITGTGKWWLSPD